MNTALPRMPWIGIYLFDILRFRASYKETLSYNLSLNKAAWHYDPPLSHFLHIKKAFYRIRNPPPSKLLDL